MNKIITRPRGRPRLPDGEAKTVFTAFKISESEDKAIREASKRADMDKSQWMRNALMKEALAT